VTRDEERAVALTIARHDLTTILDHCSAAYPNEACGILGGTNGRVGKVYPMRNVRPSPVSYEMDAAEQFRVMKDIRQAGLVLVGIFHSHISSPAYPSSVDVEQAYWPGTLFPNYPEAVYVILSLRDQGQPVIKGYLIRDGAVSDVPVNVE